MHRWLIGFVCALLSAGCTERPQGKAQDPGGATAPGVEPAHAAKEQRTLTLAPDELRVEEDRVSFEPESRVQKARYEVYRFDKRAFVSAVGAAPPPAPLRVTVELLTSTERRAPTSPNTPSPQGGIVITVHECRIVHVEP